MERLVMSKKLISISLVIWFVALLVGGGASLFGSDERRYLQVTLRDKSTVNFEIESFNFNWSSSQIKEDGTCDVTVFSLGEINEITIYYLGLNSCDGIDGDWLCEVSFTDHTRLSVQGYIPFTSQVMTGVVYGTQEERTIAIKDISLISIQ